MKASDYLTRYLYSRGVRTIFELPGGMITHILNSLYEFEKIRVVSMHHEQAAAFAADAAGRLTGVPGVAMATSGPGATNLLTGIGSCYYDSSPAVFITGQVNRHELKGTRDVRQLGFQENDIVNMAKPVTKAAWQVMSVEELPAMLERAFDLALEGRPGPVLLDIPMDVQNASVDVADGADIPLHEDRGAKIVPATQVLTPELWQRLRDTLQHAERPLLLVGAGIRASGSQAEFLELARVLQIPVVNSLLAVDVLPYEHPLRVGMIGSYANRWANHAVGASDVIVVLGSRLDIRQTGNDVAFFKGERTIVHVDVEPGEMNNRVLGCIAVQTELKPFLHAAVEELGGVAYPDWSGWREEIGRLRAQFGDHMEQEGGKGINPNVFMHQLSSCCGKAGAYLVDVGQHQMWAAQSTEVGASQRWLTSGGMGSMGFALPAAIGAAVCLAPAPVVMVAGDGGFQCNLQELQTVVRNRLPIKMVVMNNRAHGMVRQFQQTYFKEQYQSTVHGYDSPDFVRVAEAFGVPGAHVRNDAEVQHGLEFLWADPLAPALIEVAVDLMTNAYPKLAFGKPLTEMEPHAQPTTMERS